MRRIYLVLNPAKRLEAISDKDDIARCVALLKLEVCEFALMTFILILCQQTNKTTKYAMLPGNEPHTPIPSGKPTMTAIGWLVGWNQLEAEESEMTDDEVDRYFAMKKPWAITSLISWWQVSLSILQCGPNNELILDRSMRSNFPTCFESL